MGNGATTIKAPAASSSTTVLPIPRRLPPEVRATKEITDNWCRQRSDLGCSLNRPEGDERELEFCTADSSTPSTVHSLSDSKTDWYHGGRFHMLPTDAASDASTVDPRDRSNSREIISEASTLSSLPRFLSSEKLSECEATADDADVIQTFTSNISVDSSRSHIELWADEKETLFMFDWDDTLWATSYLALTSDEKLKQEPMKNLERYMHSVETTLRLAATMGKVVIVTMSSNGWVYDCIRPDKVERLRHLIRELGIDVVEAPTLATARELRQSAGNDRDASHYLKTRAMQTVIKAFYEKKSWKNIISIGDSEAERLALQDVVFRRLQKDRDGGSKNCRCKTVRLASKPTLEDLTNELNAIAQWLPTLANHDGDLDLGFDGRELTFAGIGGVY